MGLYQLAAQILLGLIHALGEDGRGLLGKVEAGKALRIVLLEPGLEHCDGDVVGAAGVLHLDAGAPPVEPCQELLFQGVQDV